MKKILPILSLSLVVFSARATTQFITATLVNVSSVTNNVSLWGHWTSGNNGQFSPYQIALPPGASVPVSITIDYGITLGAGDFYVQFYAYPGWAQTCQSSHFSNTQLYQDTTLDLGTISVNQPLCFATNAPPACFTNLSWYIQNQSGMAKNIAVGYGNGDGSTTPVSAVQNVANGQYFRFTINGVACSNAASLHLLISSPFAGGNLVDTGIGGSPTNTPTSGFPNGQTFTNSDGGIFTNSAGGPALWTQTPSVGMPSSSNIVWSAAAQSGNTVAAIQDAASVAHDDITKFSSQTHSDFQALSLSNSLAIGAQTMAITNQLGQISLWTRSNNDAMWQQYGVLTNIAKNLSNQVAGVSSSNVWVMNWPTNGQYSTNNQSLTNYATESTLSNLLSSVTNSYGVSDFTNSLDTSAMVTNGSISIADLTNGGFEVDSIATTNYSDAVSQSAVSSAELQGAETTWQNFISAMTPAAIDENFAAVDMTFDFGSVIPYIGSQKIDFNPMNNSQIAPLFDYARQLFVWLLAFLYLRRCAEDSIKALDLIENARGVVVTGPTTKRTYY